MVVELGWRGRTFATWLTRLEAMGCCTLCGPYDVTVRPSLRVLKPQPRRHHFRFVVGWAFKTSSWQLSLDSLSCGDRHPANPGSGAACRGQSVPVSALRAALTLKPPAAALLTGQAARERAPALKRLRLVRSFLVGLRSRCDIALAYTLLAKLSIELERGMLGYSETVQPLLEKIGKTVRLYGWVRTQDAARHEPSAARPARRAISGSSLSDFPLLSATHSRKGHPALESRRWRFRFAGRGADRPTG